MTNQQKNEAISDACPRRFERRHEFACHYETEDNWYFQYNGQWTRCLNGSIIDDLNAMYEAETGLKGDKDIKYVNELFHRVGINRLYYMGAEPLAFPADRQMKVINATAAQRAEAFLRTIGKWKE
jgi:hypothetical protein